MNRLAVAMILVPALVACTSAPSSKQPVQADRLPCMGEGIYEGAKNYARYIRHVATPATRRTRPGPPCVSIDG